MIKFHCPNCKKKLGVPDDYAGRRIRCSGCNHPSVVPNPIVNTTPDTDDSDLLTAEEIFGPKKTEDRRVCSSAAHANSPDDDLKLAPEDPPPPPDPHLEKIRLAPRKPSRHQSKKAEAALFPSDEVVVNPPGYWPFAFPLRGTGLGMIGIFILCDVVLALLSISPLLRMLGILFAVLGLIVRAYLYWYLYLCVQTTATGKIRSPDVLQENDSDVMELIVRMVRIFLVLLASLTPAILYYVYITTTLQPRQDISLRTDSLFWGLLVGGLFFLPMMLLSVILHDSAMGLNPVVILRSVFKTLPKYLVLILCFSVPVGLTIATHLAANWLGPWFSLPAEAMSLYLFMVAAALLGRFFYRNEKQLNWEV